MAPHIAKATGLALALLCSVSLHSQAPAAQRAHNAACDNEDFESGAAGAITASNAVQGWTVFKLNPPITPPIDNCQLFTSNMVTRSNPTAATLFNSNGYIDTLVGSGYPIYSVFGPGTSNGGEVYNPGISAMYGNSFFRLGDASGTPYNHHGMEKTITVTPANSLFRFAYLSVVKAGVSCCDAPSVRIAFLNASSGNTLLPCSMYSVTAPSAACLNSSAPPLTASTNTSTSGASTYYHKWKVVAVDLTPYIGNQITFRVVVTYCSGGCTKHGYCYLDTQCAPMQIRVNSSIFPANSNSVTFSACGVQQATVVAPPDFSQYQWSGPGGFSSTLSTITTTTSGVYTLNIQTAGTCSLITKYVGINLNPAGSPSVSSSASLSCPGKPVKLTATGLISYSWTVPGNTSTVNVSPTVTTSYTVSGYNSYGCFGSAVITQSVAACLGVPHRESASGVQLYPNPSYGELNVRLPAGTGGAVLEIRNALGAVVLQHQLERENNAVSTAQLAPGIYYCTVTVKKQPVFYGRLEVR